MRQSIERNRFDLWWKWFLRQFLKEFLALVAPDLHALIDWTRGVEFIDKELLPASPKSRSRRLYVDCLFKVYLNTGEAQLLLIHIEVQAQREALFPKRMFRYFARLFLEYDLPILSLAVLVDEHPRWRPDTFEYAFGGCELRFKFRVVKLIELDRAQLEQSRNPASIVLLAFLRARETEGDMNLRLEARKQLAILARERGYNEWLIARLDELLEGIMQLPEILEKEYERALEEYKQLKGSPFISAAERIGLRQGLLEGYQEGRADGLAQGRAEGLEQGRAEGLVQGRAESARNLLGRLLKAKYGSVADEIIPQLDSFTNAALLEQLFEEALNTDSIDAFRSRVQEYLQRGEA
ncbi:MAG: hypothetical protein NZ556_04485 [Fimbriimonadales bacterium]|nr:hypothetical protein [Fimbriimonadales bacterium]